MILGLNYLKKIDKACQRLNIIRTFKGQVTQAQKHSTTSWIVSVIFPLLLQSVLQLLLNFRADKTWDHNMHI